MNTCANYCLDHDYLKMVLVSDIHLIHEGDGEGLSRKFIANKELPNTLELFSQIVNDEIKPDLVIDLGDRIIDLNKEYDIEHTQQVFQAVDGSVNCPVFHVDGNHDIINLSKEELSEFFHSPMLPYSTTFNGWKLIFIDSHDPMIKKCGGQLSENQLEWLTHEMNCDSLPKIVFSHHPLNQHYVDRNLCIPSKFYPLMILQNKEEVKSILENGKNFVAHASGHLHFWGLRSTNHGTYIVNPPLSVLYPNNESTPGYFMEVYLWKEGRVDCLVHSVNPRRVEGSFTNR